MALKDLFSDANEGAANDARIKALQAGNTAFSNQTLNGAQAASTDYSRALGLYDGLSALGGAGTSMYGNALGLNGADGNAAATAAFQAGPGYQFALDQGLDTLDRRAASRGMLGSGNNSLDTINYAQGAANQEYGSWLDRLSGVTDMSRGVAGDQSGLLTGRAGVTYDANNRLATQYANSANAQGDSMGNYLEGRDATGANIFGAITGGLSLGAKLLGIGGFAPAGASGAGVAAANTPAGMIKKVV